MPAVAPAWRSIRPSRSSIALARRSWRSAEPYAISSGAPRRRSMTAADSSPRTEACLASARRASIPVSHGTAVPARSSATSRITLAAGRIAHSSATVAVATMIATRNGAITRTVRSCSDSTSSTNRAIRSPLRNAGSPAGRERLEPPVDLDAEVGQRAKRGVVSHESLRVAEQPLRQAEELHGHDRQRERRLRWVLGRPRDQPRGRRQQADPSTERAGPEQAGGHQPPCRGAGECGRLTERRGAVVLIERAAGATGDCRRHAGTATRPRSTTRSASATSAGRCATTITVRPSISRSTPARTSRSVAPSRLAVGSSSSSSGASRRKTRASASR